MYGIFSGVVKRTAANINKVPVRWSLPWLPKGRCDSFTKWAILLFVPPTSGVYGLLNLDCQVFIGESANIQEALLCYERETNSRFQNWRPTGFTFEPCAAELRKSRVAELIARFHPVFQTETALNETWSASNGLRVTETGLGGQEDTYTDDPEFLLHEREKQLKVRKHFYFKQTHGVALATIFVASLIVLFYPGVTLDYAAQKRANGANATSAQAEISLRPQSVSSIDTDGGIANPSAEPTPAKPDVHGSASTPNMAVGLATNSTPATDRESLQTNASPMAHSSGSANLGKKWSVQVSATPAKDIADTLVQRLKAKGYDGYVIQAKVKGQTYYRVRVGSFDSRKMAESVHQSLARQEGYRDAYSTSN
jgi:cell division septation protein DedD